MWILRIRCRGREFEDHVEYLQLLFEGEDVLVLRKVGGQGCGMYERDGVAEVLWRKCEKEVCYYWLINTYLSR